AGKESLPGTGQPLRGRRFEALHLVGALRHPADRGPAGVVERAQHPGDIAQWRVPRTTLLDRARRFALEIDDQEIVVGEQDLAEVQVAVMPRAQQALG